MSESHYLQVGDQVEYHGLGAKPRDCRVTGLVLTRQSFQKHGQAVQRVDWDLVKQNLVLVELDGGENVYGQRIEPKRHHFTPAERDAVLAGLAMLQVFIEGENTGGFDLDALSAAANRYYARETADGCDLAALVAQLEGAETAVAQ